MVYLRVMTAMKFVLFHTIPLFYTMLVLCTKPYSVAYAYRALVTARTRPNKKMTGHTLMYLAQSTS